MDKILNKKAENGKSDEDSLLVDLQNNTAIVENSSAISYKVKLICIIQSRDPTLRGSPEWCENYVCTKTCTHKFIASLFAIVSN